MYLPLGYDHRTAPFGADLHAHWHADKQTHMTKDTVRPTANESSKIQTQQEGVGLLYLQS